MLIELLRPAGPELARRWLTTLLMVDRDDREALVEMLERYVIDHYAQGERPARPPAQTAGPQGGLDVVHPPQQREGYVEQVHVTYEVEAGEAPQAAAARPKHKPRRSAR